MDDSTVRVVSRRMVQPFSPRQTLNGNGCCRPTPEEEEQEQEQEVEVIHLTPWDLRLIGVDCIHKGVLLPAPPASGGDVSLVVEALASSFARALGRFYPFAGRLAAEDRGDETVTLSLRCTGEGAEFVHAVAPDVTVADVVAASLYRTPPVVSALFHPSTSDRVPVGADVAFEFRSRPLVAAQVTELADGVFVAASMNHSAGDGAAFWHFFNTWSEINNRGSISADNDLRGLSTPAPVLQRWFAETRPVPIPVPFGKLQHAVLRRFERAAVLHDECFFTFSAASVRELKKRANDEIADGISISAVHAVLAHLWRAVCRARRLSPEQGTFYTLVLGCRGRMDGIPPGYVGNAMVFGRAEATAGEIEGNGLGWAARMLTRVAASSFDEARMRESLDRWVRDPTFTSMSDLSSGSGSSTGLVSGDGDLAAVDVFGNDFGWGKPVAVRSGPGNKADGKATVLEGPERGGSLSLEVCLARDALARLVDDEEFMDAVTTMPPA